MHVLVKNATVCPRWTATCIRKPFLPMTLIQSTRSRPRSHVLHGPAENTEIQHLDLAPNRTVTESHLLGVCSAADAEQNGVLLGLPPAATLLSHRGVPPHIRRPSRKSRLQEPLDLPPDAQPTVGFGCDRSALEYSHALKLTPPHDPVAMVFRCFAG